MSFPLRYQLAVALVALNIVGTAALARFAYNTSRDSLEEQALRTVGSLAQAREQTLVQLLQRRQGRMAAFLGSVESLCGERTPSGRFGWERQCVHMALSGFRTAERATAADLRYRGTRLTAAGNWPAGARPAVSRALDAVSAPPPDDYTVAAARGDLTLEVRFPLDQVVEIFQDRSGLEANGEIFLTDAAGALLTPVRYPQAASGGVLGPAVQSCLKGSVGEALEADYRGTQVISGFRPVPILGGGCIVANVQYSDVLVPIHRLGRTFFLASIGFILAGVLISLVVARAATRPLARLAAAARALEAGHFDAPVPVEGPTEIRQLGGALSAMARSVGDLLHQEHEARVAAEVANRTKDDFLAMVSHELRTPLNAILGWASIMLNHQGDGPSATRALRAVERSARTQAKLIDELLDISRIASGKLQLNIAAPVSLTSIVDGAIEAIRPTADAKRLEIVRLVVAEPPDIVGDSVRLQQIVVNLLSNAVRFTPDGGRIEVALETVGDAVEIRVTDTGIGIAQEFLPHVFERFRQADSGTTRSHGGLGLGLAIVRHLAELHGGSVRAESGGPGAGATFVVRLPQGSVDTTAAPLDPGTRLNVPPLLGGTQVLVVDDDADTRDVLRTILEDAGASVATMASAAETRDFLERGHADLLIADIGMPKEDGYSLIRSLRAQESEEVAHVPAIALTAHARPEDVARALASGFQMHLAKPIDSSRLLAAVTSTLVQSWTH